MKKLNTSEGVKKVRSKHHYEEDKRSNFLINRLLRFARNDDKLIFLTF